MLDKAIGSPKHVIRAKAIGIICFENRLLVCEVLNNEGVLKDWCSLGGGGRIWRNL
ncbi:hypothetical protein [Candidatus Protochlamydia sp. W-9]|uniref:hypothetical protein n=1 Tax=Candidatus Protochlamydia sp. W-9 TaxID=1785087 RepID=UPI000AF19A08|nr:hypothetical protein [Candidatus Protochlamydia sp. W-9]